MGLCQCFNSFYEDITVNGKEMLNDFTCQYFAFLAAAAGVGEGGFMPGVPVGGWPPEHPNFGDF